MLRSAIWAVLAGSLSLVACSEDSDNGGGSGGTGGTGTSDDCTAIIEACHLKDTGDPGAINDCHQAAHDNDTATCTSKKVECVALCDAAPLVDGGAGGHAGAGGHVHGGAGGMAGMAGMAGHSHGGAGGTDAGTDGG
ncbi:MAG: hypothetical protein R3B13_31650 [Polyangiaceae bacterium]